MHYFILKKTKLITKHKLNLILFFCISIFGCSTHVYNKTNDRNIASLPTHSEALMDLRLKESEIKKNWQQITALATDTLIDLNPPEFGAQEGLITLSGRVRLDILKNGTPQIHKFVLDIIPKVRIDEGAATLGIELQSLRLNGEDYANTFSLASKIFLGIIASDRIRNYLAIDEKTGQLFEDTIDFEEETKTVFIKMNIKNLLEATNFSLRTESEESLKELRIWHFGPRLMRGTSIPIFHLALGRGYPSADWLNNLKELHQSDSSVLIATKQQDIELYSQPTLLQSYFRQLQKNSKELSGLIPLRASEEAAIQRFYEEASEIARYRLTKEKPLFRDRPRVEYESVKTILENSFNNLVEDLITQRNRNLELKKKLPNDAPAKGWPIVEQWISQKTLNTVVRFFRDIKVGNTHPLRDFKVTIRPDFPGVEITGLLVLPQSELKNIGFNKELPPLPFQAITELKYDPQGYLQVRILKFVLGTKDQKISLNLNSENGRLLYEETFRIITESLGSALNLAPGSTPDPKIDIVEVIRNSLLKLADQYKQSLKSNDIKSQIVTSFIDNDLIRNPIIQQIKAEGLEKYRPQRISANKQTLILKMDPYSIVPYFDTGSGDIKIWNIQPINSKELDNRNYLELAIGLGSKSVDYHRLMSIRDQQQDWDRWSRDKLFQENPVDVRLGVDLKKISDVITHLLNQIDTEAQAANKQKDEFEYIAIDKFALQATSNGVLQANMHILKKNRSKRSIVNPKGWFGDKFSESEISMNVTADISLTTKLLSNITSLNREKDIINMLDRVLSLDITKISLEASKFKTLQKTLKFVGIDLSNLELNESARARAIKSLIIKVLNPFFENKKDLGNLRLGDIRVNEFVRILTDKNEIYLALNPRMISSAFDINLASEKIVLDPVTQRLVLDLSTAGNMIETDKKEFLKIIQDTKDKFKPLLIENNPQRFLSLLKQSNFSDDLFVSQQSGKSSILGKIARLVKSYPQISKVGQSRFAEEKNNDIKYFSTCGIELAYLTSALLTLTEQIKELEIKVKNFGLTSDVKNIAVYQELIEKKEDIIKKRLMPLVDLYNNEFQELNQVIVNRGVTDWNRAFYADALFANSIFQLIDK